MPDINDSTREFLETNGQKILSAMNEAVNEVATEGEWRIRNIVISTGQRQGRGHWEKVDGGWIYWK